MAKRVCPHWIGYLLLNPLRRHLQNPEKILGPYITSGMTVLDIGPGMGFFTLPLATMVGANGKVICVDVQEKMLQSLYKRALSAQLADRIVLRVGKPDSLTLDDFNGKIDFVLAFAVIHEIPDVPNFFREVANVMKPGTQCLLVEPKGHVSEKVFEQTLIAAAQKGLSIMSRPEVKWSHAALLRKE